MTAAQREATALILSTSDPARLLFGAASAPCSLNESSLKKAFRTAARLTHPDKSPLPEADEAFKKLCEAYETLLDSCKRASEPPAASWAPPSSEADTARAAPAPPPPPPKSKSKMRFTVPKAPAPRPATARPSAPSASPPPPTAPTDTPDVTAGGERGRGSGSSGDESDESDDEDESDDDETGCGLVFGDGSDGVGGGESEPYDWFELVRVKLGGEGVSQSGGPVAAAKRGG